MDITNLDFQQARIKQVLFKSRLRSILYGVREADPSLFSLQQNPLGQWLTTTVKPGKHTVELRYTPKGLAIGAAVSGTCVAGVAGYLILVHIRRKKQQSAG